MERALSKDAERNYLTAIGEIGFQHAVNKPFSDHDCGLTLASIGTVMHLLPNRPARILDLGCGTGWTSMFFARHGYEVIGRDIAETMIEAARGSQIAQNIAGNLQFEVGDFEIGDAREPFDAVVFFDSLHHAEDEAAAIRYAFQSLRPGGIMVTHEPGEGHATAPWSISAMEKFGVTEKDMPPHLIIKHARAAGFTEFRIMPMLHDIFRLYYGDAPPRLSSKRGLKRANLLLKGYFHKCDRTSSIVVSKRPI